MSKVQDLKINLADAIRDFDAEKAKKYIADITAQLEYENKKLEELESSIYDLQIKHNEISNTAESKYKVIQDAEKFLSDIEAKLIDLGVEKGSLDIQLPGLKASIYDLNKKLEAANEALKLANNIVNDEVKANIADLTAQLECKNKKLQELESSIYDLQIKYNEISNTAESKYKVIQDAKKFLSDIEAKLIDLGVEKGSLDIQLPGLKASIYDLNKKLEAANKALKLANSIVIDEGNLDTRQLDSNGDKTSPKNFRDAVTATPAASAEVSK